MGLIFSVPMREDQVADKIKTETDKAVLNDIRATVTLESSERQAADIAIESEVTVLRSALDNEIINRENSERDIRIEFQSALNSETSLRESNESALNATLLNTSAELESLINSEKDSRIAGDTAVIQTVGNEFNPKISSLATALSNEITLSAQRDSTMYAELTASIAAVNSSQGGGVASLKSAIDNEITTRQNQTASLGSALAKEVADRQSAVTGIQNQISNAVANEASTRAAADTSLQNSLASAQSNLNGAISNEASARTSADTALQSAITSTQNNLSTALSNEASARAAADTALQNSITSAVSSISDSLKPFTSSTTLAAGKAGLVPPPPKLSSPDEVVVLTNKGFQTLADTNIVISATPAQGTIPNYTGNSITPQWINYENQKLTVSGETSGTNAGTYTAKFKPIGLYVWADGTQAEKSVTWRINPQVAQVPTASTKTFTYDGSAKTLSVTNPNSGASNQTGTISATNAGNYTATYKLKSTTNYVWSDGTTTDKSISWSITVLKLAKPTASTVTFTYDGNNKSPSITNFNSTYEDKTGTDTAKAAASYSVTFSLKNTSNTTWADGSITNVVINWTINKVQVTIPTAAVTNFDFTNSEITLNINNPDSTYINQSGTTKASAVGNYTVNFTLKDTANYIWKDGTNTAKKIDWTIRQVTFAKPTASVTAFTYNQNSQGPVISNFDATFMNKDGTESATAAGSYSITYSLKDKTNHKWTDGTSADVKIDWSISPLVLEKPTASSTTFVYNESLITLPVTNYNSNYEDASGTTIAIDAGSYSVTYSLKDKTNTKWTGNSTADVKINWSITRKPLTEAQSNFVSDTATNLFTWDGHEHSITEILKSSVDNSLVYNPKYYDLSGTTSATEILSYSEYRAEISPKANYSWSDGTYNKKVICWNFKKIVLNPPTAPVTEFEYTGALITLQVDGFDAATMIRYESSDDGRYTHSATDVSYYAGYNYGAIFRLKDKTHYAWADTNSDMFYIYWKITKKILPIPSIEGDTSFVYTGQVIAPNIINYNPSWMTQQGTLSAVDVGSYNVAYKLIDDRNTEFSDGSITNKSLNWRITKKALTEEQSTGFAQAKPLTYNGEVQTVTITNYDPSLHRLGGAFTSTNAGSANARIYPSNNHTWADGTTSDKTVRWTIDKKKVTIPSFLGASAFVYDGSTKSPTFKDFNEDECYIYSGTTEAVEKGNYSIIIGLNNTSNYCWADDTTTRKTFNWSITAKLLTKPTRTDTNSFTYDGNAKTITVANYDSSTMIFSGTLSEINAGNYSATYSIKDLANYAWADGSTADVVINWSIARQKLSAAQSNWSLTKNGWEYYGTGTFASNLYQAEDSTAKNYVTFKSTSAYLQNAGDYTLSVYPDNNHLWNDGSSTPKNFQFTITRAVVQKAYISSESIFEYDGNTKSITILPSFGYQDPDTGGYINSAYRKKYTVTGSTSATNVGIYTITVSLDEPNNAVWDDGTTDDVVLTWEIKQGDGLSKPYLKTPTVQWSGSNVSPSIGNYDSTLMTQSGTTTASAIGSYTVTYSLKDKNNYKWADGTTNDVTLTWQIVRRRMSEAQSTPYATGEYTYNGAEKNGVALLSAYNASGVTLSGTQKATNAGSYVITLTPTSTYAWSDGTTAPKNVSWTIAPLTVAKPRLSGTSTFTYDGNVKSPVVLDYNSTYESQTGTASATQVGTHTITYKLKDKNNTTWTDGTTADVSLTWTINTLKLTKPSIKNSTFTYDGNEKSPTFNNYVEEYEAFGSSDTAVNAGTYSVTVALKDKNNTKWSDNTSVDLTFNWTITPRRLTKPSLTNTTFTYDGNEKSPTLNNYDSTFANQTGTIAATNAGDYTATFALIDSSNTTWADSTVAVVNCSWTINKATPTLTFSTGSITLDNTNSTVTVAITYTGDGELYFSGSGSILESGSFVATLYSDIDSEVTMSTARINNVNKSEITFTAKGYGAGRTGYVSSRNSTNYNEVRSVGSIEVTSTYIGTLDNTPLSIIQQLAKNGTATNYWDIGDSKIIRTKTYSSLSSPFEEFEIRMVIIGFNHNSAYEGSNTIHFALSPVKDTNGRTSPENEIMGFNLIDLDNKKIGGHIYQDYSNISLDMRRAGWESSRINAWLNGNRGKDGLTSDYIFQDNTQISLNGILGKGTSANVKNGLSNFLKLTTKYYHTRASMLFDEDVDYPNVTTGAGTTKSTQNYYWIPTAKELGINLSQYKDKGNAPAYGDGSKQQVYEFFQNGNRLSFRSFGSINTLTTGLREVSGIPTTGQLLVVHSTPVYDYIFATRDFIYMAVVNGDTSTQYPVYVAVTGDEADGALKPIARKGYEAVLIIVICAIG